MLTPQIKDFNDESFILNNKEQGKEDNTMIINIQQSIRQQQGNGVEEELKNIHQSQSNNLQNEKRHEPSSSTLIEDDQLKHGDNIPKKYLKQKEMKEKQQPKKRKTIHKEIPTKIQYRANQNQNVKNDKTLQFKNQIKGFISKYFKRLSKQKRENLLDFDIPMKMFERMKGCHKKTDLFLIINQFFSSGKPTQEDYELYLSQRFQQQYEQIQPDEEVLQDDQYLERQSQLKIQEREFQLLTQLRDDYLKDPQYEGYDGFIEFINYYNRLTSFFRRDIYKYLMSQSYVHAVCVKKAEKFDQIYIKNIILNIILNPKVLI
ncbi:hypothetical protein TTHERM_000077669 (macronuclear) [Tetrahymena thermophila SB210]|uniref:Uncharacterized protein n=1 Tax=Tetrahymena thermophila (strain SB210) TaxID=312017 RepID=W7XJY8_TETTS|nr:hypothetical protein TTHERM_000077669 [Tetrahymena thermophila SB210]EWS74444.1 hypothetical protein TTHERM_000077669 [Tetrahymena thermophila SB210]|eukprot:XP_012653021.1 hypothetical protein TTHERM_000077669 [Tetrahymena thermophila SB210]